MYVPPLSRRGRDGNAVNQYTMSSQSVSLPVLYFGRVPVEKNADFKVKTPIVDYVESQVGGISTIFQRMNKQGDMLRVASNVKRTDGTRAVGTFMPVVNPDGSANPVVSTVLRGETYLGMSKTLGEWYITIR